MISILLGGSSEDPDINAWTKEHGKLARFIPAGVRGILKTYLRGVVRSTQMLTRLNPITGKRVEGGVANDPIIVHFDDATLLEFQGDSGVRRGFSRLAGFMEPPLDLGLNLRVVVFNRHHDLVQWLQLSDQWPDHWPEPIFIS